MSAWIDQLRALRENATDGPWLPFHVDDDHAMNCHGVTTDPDFERNEDYIGPTDARDGTPRRIVAMTLYQAQRIVCHEAGRWDFDARFIAQAANLWPLLLDAIQAADTLVEVTICRRFITMEFCRNRPELDRAEWCVTCDHAQRTADALGRLREQTR